MTLNKKQIAGKEAKRDVIRRNVQRDCGQIDAFLVNPDGVELTDVKLLAKRLGSYKKQLEAIDDELIQYSQDADQDVADSMEVQDNILNAVEKFNIYSESRQTPTPTVSSDAGSSQSNNTVTVIQQSGPKLPDLEIAKFAGNPLKWREFWDSFETTYHSHPNLTKAIKLKYLKRYLEGDAARLVDGFESTDDNYDQVVAFLKERFGDEQVAIFAHLEALLAMEPTSNMDVSQLRQKYDECEKHIRSLVSLGLHEDTFGLVFTPIILSKLPKFVRIDLHRRIGMRKWTLTELRELLRDEINARDRGEHTFGGTSSKSGPPSNSGYSNKGYHAKKPNHGKPVATVSQLAAPSGVKGKKGGPSCSFCGENHYSDKCTKFADSDSRRAKIKGSCFACLGPHHSSKQCQNRRPCYYCGQTGHHQSLCNDQFGKKSNQSASRAQGGPQQGQGLNIDAQEFVPSRNQGNNMAASFNVAADETGTETRKAVLQTAKIDVRGNKGEGKAQSLLDSGSTTSCITEKTAKRIGARQLPDVILSVGRFMDKKRSTATFRQCEFDVVLSTGKVKTMVAKVMPVITAPIQRLPIPVKQHPILAQIQLADQPLSKPEMVEIDILIGQDYYYDFVQPEQIRCADGLVLLDTLFGYVAAGTVMCEAAQFVGQNVATMMSLNASPVRDCQFNLEKFWRLEDIGIKEQSAVNNEDDIAVKAFNDSIQFYDGRYHAQWPWKVENPDLPNNFSLAKRRLVALAKRHQNDPTVWSIYDKTIRTQLEKGMVEIAPDKPSGPVNYLPHHVVVKPGKTTEYRIVYDASAKMNRDSPSLNDCLFQGPTLLPDLTGLLLRFRTNPIALVADIEKAFLQIGLKEEERDCVRFLWLRDPMKPVTPDNISILRFCRVLFGTTSGPFMLAATIEHHLRQHPSTISNQILDNLYVDNIVDGTTDPTLALGYYDEAKAVFQEASMNLRNWYTNSVEVREQIPESDRGKAPSVTVLGLKWDTSSDQLTCASISTIKDGINTKRQVLQAISGIYDPCGFAAPVSILGKILMQKLWKAKLDWDERLPEDLLAEWNKVAPSFRDIGNVQVPRLLSSIDQGARVELHCFCDASGLAYATVVYLRVISETGVSCNVVFSKTRVAPLKKLTIPRLELMAIVIGCRALKFVETHLQLPIDQKFIWNDNKAVLHWVKGSEVKTVFVKNRVAEIATHQINEFNYVPSAVNPADLPTRGMPYQAWKMSDLWWHGPEPLWKTRLSGTEIRFRSDDSAEIQASDSDEVAMIGLAPVNCEPEPPIDITKFSTFQRLLRVTCWVKRAGTRPSEKSASPTLSAEELQDAKFFWIRFSQRKHFAHALTTPGKRHSLLRRQLGLFEDQDGILRCRGRFENADITDSAKYPILLPKNEYFTKLVILDYHSRFAHAGVKHTLSAIRNEFWIIQGRSQVKKTLAACVRCRKYEGGAFQIPPPPQLPSFRLAAQKPFSFVGTDFLGPLYVRNEEGAPNQKVWICLFTCAVVRAVHLEVVTNLSTQEFLLGFRRFVSLNGKPRMIISDNGKQFVLSEKVLKRAWLQIQTSEDVQNYAANEGITWNFITENAPWMGGFYERLVKSVKTALKKSLDKRLLSVTELRTVAYEISALLNTRPLIYVGTEVGEEILTPAHFLGRNTACIPPGVARGRIDETTLGGQMVIGWKRLQGILNDFWGKWSTSYLQYLREHQTVSAQRNSINAIPLPGAVVLIRDNLPRGSWKIGVIDQQLTSTDGKCRSVVVRLPSGNKVNRPVKLLYPLELPAPPSPANAVASEPNSDDEEY